MARPALYWLAEEAARRGARLCLLLQPFLSPLFEDFDADVLLLPSQRSTLKWWQSVQQIRTYRPDAALLLAPSLRSGLESILSRIPIRVGHPDDHRRALLTHPIERHARKRGYSRAPFYEHVSRELMRLAYEFMMVLSWPSEPNWTGIQDWDSWIETHARLKANETQLFEVKDKIKNEIWMEWRKKAQAETVSRDAHQVRGDWEMRPLIGLHPLDSGGNTRRWPLEYYRALMRALWQERGAILLLHGGPADGTILQGLARTHDGPVRVCAGETSLALRGLISTLQAEDCFVTGDTGPMHLAAALALPGVALFGGTDPALTGPIGGSLQRLHRAPEHCVGCYRVRCPTQQECLRALSVDEVLGAVCDVLGATP